MIEKNKIALVSSKCHRDGRIKNIRLPWDLIMKPCLWWILAKKQPFLAHETLLKKKKKPPKLLKYCLKPLLVSKKLPDKNLKPLLVSQKLPNLQFRLVNPHQKAKVANFKIWNFGAELSEINFKCWNVPKCQHFWVLGYQFSCKSCC